MQKVVSVETMRNSDAFTIKNYIDSKELMYKAGVGVYQSYNWNGRVAIVCGSGNNAGDGYVLAMLLKQNNIECRLFLLSEKFSDDGKYYFDKCTEAGIVFEKCHEFTDFSGYNIIVDCIFGTGFSGSVKGIASDIIEEINICGFSGCKVISVDINSGLNGDSGMAEKCVKSHLTISIGYYKTGHFLNHSKDNIKTLCNCNIGIKLIGDYYYIVDAEEFKTLLKKENKSLVNLDIKEFAWKNGYSTDEILCNLIMYAKKYAEQNNVAVLLEGATAILSDDKTTYISTDVNFNH